MQMVEEGCQALAAVAGGDAVEARVGAELFVHFRVQVAERREVELHDPAAFVVFAG